MRFGAKRNAVGIELVVESEMKVADVLDEIQDSQAVACRIFGIYQ
jgi:hypothetical protein